LIENFHTKRIVCLANSRKYSGRCVAGKELTQGRIGAWIRPVNGTQTKELSLDDITLQNGTEPRPLDVISVPLEEACPQAYNSENHYIEHAPWIWEGTLPWSQVPQLCDPVDQIWINGYHSHNGENDQMPEDLVREMIVSSLLFFRPDELRITVGLGPMGSKKVRAKFSYHGETYSLMITDPVVEALYVRRELGEYLVNGGETFLTVSISDPHRGFCHKLVAGIVPNKSLQNLC
jgi:ATP-dependent DNA helicase RecQ